MRTLTVCLLLLMPSMVSAQPKVDTKGQHLFAWPEDKQWIADRIGDGLVVVSLLLPCAVNAAERKDKACWKDQAIRTGVVLGAAEAVKRLAHRTRPDGSDNKSFFSMHTALTCVSGLNRLDDSKQWVGAALCGVVGYFRIAANKHWMTDVLTGAGVGASVVFSWGRD